MYLVIIIIYIKGKKQTNLWPFNETRYNKPTRSFRSGSHRVGAARRVPVSSGHAAESRFRLIGTLRVPVVFGTQFVVGRER